MKDIEKWLRDYEEEAIETLKAFCRLPSVSTDPAFASDVRHAAEFVANQLEKAGFPIIEIIETNGHPTIVGEWCNVPNAPTILIYGHYDVQPPDPIDKWKSSPFEPVIRDDRLYARGVSDDKGPLSIPIAVVAAFREVRGKLPINIKVIIEGEEESGSPHFVQTVERLKDRLACDLVVSADGAMWRADLPSMTVASRGLVALEVSVKGAHKDLHSGRHGGSAPNAIRALTRMLASMHDDNGNIVVDGFADTAKPPDPAITTAIEEVNFDAGKYFDDIGAPRPDPLPSGIELLTLQWLRPTLEFNGIRGGYIGVGTKTVIPSEASVKITCRLIAGQKPDQVVADITQHLEAALPQGYHLEIMRRGEGSEAFSLDPELPALSIAEDVLADIMGSRPLRVAMGATIPIGAVFARHLGVGTIFFSFSTSDEDYHAPNEFFRLSNFRSGMIAWARLIDRLGRDSK
ncbi:MAG: peptidase M20 [Rhodobacteraceae bacterium]|nr:peptidase M20 [Paracoccaceae bacterium]